MRIDHVSFGSNDLSRARAFYDPVLATLGLRLLNQDGQSLDYGADTLVFSLETPVDGRPASVGNGTHIALSAIDRRAVQAFHAAGLAHGGRDAGMPGPRLAYGPDYYSAFLFDPDGNKVEAVTSAPT